MGYGTIHAPCKKWNDANTDALGNPNTDVLIITKKIIIAANLDVDCKACYLEENKTVPEDIFSSIRKYLLHLRNPSKRVQADKKYKEATDAIVAIAETSLNKLTTEQRAKLTSRDNAKKRTKIKNVTLSDIRARLNVNPSFLENLTY